jgi:hypothetical protein
MKNRIIIIGLIFNIVFQSFGLQPNNFAEKKSNKTTYKKSENSDNSNDLKSLFFEEESEENTDDESKLIHKGFESYSNSNLYCLIFQNCRTKYYNFIYNQYLFSNPIFLIFRNLRI